jgi:hypothetical protein
MGRARFLGIEGDLTHGKIVSAAYHSRRRNPSNNPLTLHFQAVLPLQDCICCSFIGFDLFRVSLCWWEGTWLEVKAATGPFSKGTAGHENTISDRCLFGARGPSWSRVVLW